MFTQRPEEPTEWAGLPSEPLDRDESTDLPEQPAADPFDIGLGAGGGGIGLPIPATPIPADPSTEDVGGDDDDLTT